MILPKILEEALDFINSPRWEDQDYPGYAHIKELHKRVNSPIQYKAFRSTIEGDYILSVIEAYEEAFNDDWLPFEIIGLSITHAKEFMVIFAKELDCDNIPNAVEKLRLNYQRLSKP
jgi:hypothetical protein